MSSTEKNFIESKKSNDLEILKLYIKKVNTNFHDNKIPNESLECVCLLLTLLDSVYRKDNKYYTQVFLEECKYVVKEEKIHNYIIENVHVSSHSHAEDLLYKIQMEKILIMKKFLMKKL